MKKNIGATLALYPSPLIVVGAMVDGKPTWTLVAHAGTVAHSHLMVSLVQMDSLISLFGISYSFRGFLRFFARDLPAERSRPARCRRASSIRKRPHDSA